MEINGFKNYDMHVLRPQNTKNGELEINKIWEKDRGNNEFIFHNNLINARVNQINDMVQEVEPLF